MVEVVVLGNTDRRYQSNHEFFVKRSHFGYASIAEEALNYLPDSVRDSLIEIDVPILVFIYFAGTT